MMPFEQDDHLVDVFTHEFSNRFESFESLRDEYITGCIVDPKMTKELVECDSLSHGSEKVR